MANASDGSAQVGLDPSPGGLDRVQIGTVGWQIAIGDTGSVESLPHAGGLVRGEVVHRNNAVGTGLQRRQQHLFDKGQEHRGGVAAATVMVATSPLSASAPRMVKRFQCPPGTRLAACRT